jgi:hypothetical protein
MTNAGMTIPLQRVLVILLVVLMTSDCSVENAAEPTLSRADPLNAEFEIGGSPIRLRDGHFEMPAAPGSAARIEASVLDEPVYGHLDDDAEIDAAVILVYQSGGSGTFYYVAAATNRNGENRGTNALLLGDRVSPHGVRIENRTIVADFADRKPDEPMAATPTIDVTKYAYLDGGRLVAVPADTEVSGWVTFGHEVRSFQPCDGSTEHWLIGRSPALSDLQKSYRDTIAGARPYTPLFMEVTGSVMASPRQGFGADYAAGFFVTRLIAVKRSGHCREDLIVVESPAPGAVIESPLSIRGRARGTLYFEGDFPIVLEDAVGNVVVNSFVTAQGEWMTKEFVPFAAELSFTTPDRGGRGTLIFRKDNPTDRPELDDAAAIPVFFQK